ncbi:MAG: ELWxxDGT repeat protein [Actinomycetota bacterium]
MRSGLILRSAALLSVVGLLLTLPRPTMEARAPVLEPLPGTAYFPANDRQHGWELWASDGTAQGTRMVKDIRPGRGGRPPAPLIGVDGVLYFAADDGQHGLELWLTDGTAAGTRMVRDIFPGEKGSFPDSGYRVYDAIGHAVYFAARDGVHGQELWRTDGTPDGTSMVRDIRPRRKGAGPFGLAHLGTTLHLFADDGVHGLELWESDGTKAGTVMVADIAPGSDGSQPFLSTAGSDRLYFTANDGRHGTQLWRSDGSASGTIRLTDLAPGATSILSNLIPLGDEMYFTMCVHDCSLWATDGSVGGTRSILGRPDRYGQASGEPLAAGDAVFFTAGRPGPRQGAVAQRRTSTRNADGD